MGVPYWLARRLRHGMEARRAETPDVALAAPFTTARPPEAQESTRSRARALGSGRAGQGRQLSGQDLGSLAGQAAIFLSRPSAFRRRRRGLRAGGVCRSARSSNLVSLVSRRSILAVRFVSTRSIYCIELVESSVEAGDVILGRHVLDDVGDHFAEFFEGLFSSRPYGGTIPCWARGARGVHRDGNRASDMQNG